MNDEDRRLLRENNIMLKYITMKLIGNEVQDDIKNFIINVIANGVMK